MKELIRRAWVHTVNPLTVKFSADDDPMPARAAGGFVGPGEVRVAEVGSRLEIVSGVGVIPAQSILSGGGNRSFDGTRVSWSNRILLISAGNGSMIPSGYFRIDMPPVGTPIPVYGGATASTVTAAGISLDIWEALYYELPLGQTFHSVNNNFRVVDYHSASEIPPHWVRIAIHNGDAPRSAVWFDGMEDTGWIELPLLNGWAKYSTAYACRYKRLNGIVYIQALLNGGTSTSVGTLPVGFRPSESVFSTGFNNGTSSAVRVHVLSNGTLACYAHTLSSYTGFTLDYPADN